MNERRRQLKRRSSLTPIAEDPYLALSKSRVIGHACIGVRDVTRCAYTVSNRGSWLGLPLGGWSAANSVSWNDLEDSLLVLRM